MTLADAIYREEGEFDPESRANRNCNPGNLEYNEFTIAHGATGTDGRFAKFPDMATGKSALLALLGGPEYKDLTIAQAIARYAPSNENDTAQYVKNVCDWLNKPATTLVSEVLV